MSSNFYISGNGSIYGTGQLFGSIGYIVPTLSNFVIPNQTSQQGSLVLIPPPETNSTGAFTYTSANTTVATISGVYMVIQGAGTNNITAVQLASGDYRQSNTITSTSYTSLQRSTAGTFNNLYSVNNVSGAGGISMNGQIRTSVYDGSNNYTYFGGDFTSMKSFSTNVFKYNPTLDYVDFYIDQNKVCFVGNLTSTQAVHATAIDTSNNLLYIAGYFSTIKDKNGTYNGNNIACFNINTDTWSLLGNTISNGIGRSNYNYGMALQLDNSNNLYVSCSDSTRYYDASGSITASYIAMWNVSINRWSYLGSVSSNGYGTGIVQPTLTYDNSNNILYVTSGGTIYKDTTGTINGNYIAIWKPTVARWGMLGITGYNGVYNNVNTSVASVTLDTSYNAYISGNFTGYYNSAALTTGNYIAKYNYYTNTWSPILSISGGTINPGFIVYDGSNNRLYSSSGPLHYYDISNSSWSPMVQSITFNTYISWINYDVKTQNLYVAGNVTSVTDICGSSYMYNGLFKINSSTLVTTPIASAFNSTIASGGRMSGIPTIDPITSMVYFGTQGGVTPVYNYNRMVGYDNSNSIFFPIGKKGSNVGSNGTNGSVYCLNLDNSNNLYVGGSFTTIYDPSNTSLTGNRIAKWSPSNNSWSLIGGNTASNGFNNIVQSIVIDTSYNYLYAGGLFTTCYNSTGSITSYYSARWNLGASGWSVMGGNPTGVNLNNIVLTMALDNSKNVYVGGLMSSFYNSVTSSTCAFLIIWHVATNLWSVLGGLDDGSKPSGFLTYVGATNYVYTLEMDTSNNVLYVGGIFANGVQDVMWHRSYTYIAKWNISTKRWSPIGSNISSGLSNGTLYGSCTSLSLDISNQLLYVGGNFIYVNDQYCTNYPAKYLAVYNVATSSWKNVGNVASNGVNSIVNTITKTNTGKIIIGGNFTTVSDTSSTNVTAYYMASITPKYYAGLY